MSQRNLTILLLSLVVGYVCYVRAEQDPYARFVADGLRAIEQGALEHVSGSELFDGAMRGMVGILHARGDEHSQFLTEEEAAPLRSEIRQQFGGIGVRIGLEGDPPRLLIVSPPDPGTPAARENLLPGDHIVAIDGEPTRDMTLASVLERMRGRPGTRLELEIEASHGGPRRSVELVRELIQIESILGDRRNAKGGWHFRLEEEPRFAQVRIALFGDRTSLELVRVLEELEADGVEGVVLDLRDNAGGALDAAVAVCDVMLPAGRLVVETRGRHAQTLSRYVTRSEAAFALPLAVIVNQNSASAAEIVAACLQDHQRAVVVGERTYGKGTVQQLLPLESGRSLLKLTWASFWRPSGQQIHKVPGGAEPWGVVPDDGYALQLAPDEYAAFRKYRAWRDGYRVDAEADASAGEFDGYVDQQLELGVAALRSRVVGQGAEAANASEL